PCSAKLHARHDRHRAADDAVSVSVQGSNDVTALEDGKALIAAWETNNRVTMFLIENLPLELWFMNVPGYTRRTVGTFAAHIHNARCMWIKMIGARHGVVVPEPVNGRTVKPKELLRVLPRSSRGMINLIELAMARGGSIPPAAWQNFPT